MDTKNLSSHACACSCRSYDEEDDDEPDQLMYEEDEDDDEPEMQQFRFIPGLKPVRIPSSLISFFGRPRYATRREEMFFLFSSFHRLFY